MSGNRNKRRNTCENGDDGRREAWRPLVLRFRELGHSPCGQRVGRPNKVFECWSIPSAFSELIIAAAKSYKVVFTLCRDVVDPLVEVAPGFPQTKFIHIDAVLNDTVNVSSIDYLENEDSFVAGAMAALMTTKTGDPKTNPDRVIGAAGGIDIPVI